MRRGPCSSLDKGEVKAWFTFEAKSFDIEVEETSKGLKGCIWERRKDVISWIRFEGRSLSRLLVGLEACARASRLSIWVNFWEEEGRSYRMERGSNQERGFICCSVRDLGEKSYNLTFLEGKNLAGGWKILAEKLRKLGVRSGEEAQWEEKHEKPQREEKQRKTSTKSLPRLLKTTLSSFVEILKTEKISMGGGVYVELGEEEVRERLD